MRSFLQFIRHCRTACDIWQLPYNIGMKKNFVSLHDVHMQINGKEILRGCSGSIEPGQMVAIIGANGTGKTTLLKIICGLLQPTAGSLLIDGCTFKQDKNVYNLRKLIGFAPDTPPLYTHDTIHTYLRFIAELKQVPKQQIKKHIDLCLQVFGLEDLRYQYMHTLSKGLQQRVNLAQACIHEPKLLVLDEPTNGLDPEHCAQLKEHLAHLQKQGTTIVYTSHTYSDLLAISDFMLKVANGKLEKILLPARIPRESKVHDYADYTT